MNADKPDAKKETCASKYPNAPTRAPSGYDHENETDAYMAFRRAAVNAGFTAIEKKTRAKVKEGPCVDHGEHLNLDGTRGKDDWKHVGSMTSCEICNDTPRGPRLTRPKF